MLDKLGNESADLASFNDDAKFRKKGGEIMKLLLSSMVPGNTDNNGNHYGWYGNNGNNGNNGRSIPIPGTLLLFGGSFAGLVGWQWMIDRRRKDDTS